MKDFSFVFMFDLQIGNLTPSRAFLPFTTRLKYYLAENNINILHSHEPLQPFIRER